MRAAADDREDVIRAMLPLVRRVAARLRRLVPSLDLDDLVGDGSIGLIRAVDSFDPQRGPSLEQYARRLVLGAMLNGVRRMDPVSERARRVAREGENRRYAVAVERGSLPSVAETERDVPGYARAMAAIAWGQPLSLDVPLPEGERLSGDWSGDPARIAECRSETAVLCALVDGLAPRQRTIVLQHYYAGRSLRAIGRALSISPQRVSQLHCRAIEVLKDRARAARG